jgi:hypothetical protein
MRGKLLLAHCVRNPSKSLRSHYSGLRRAVRVSRRVSLDDLRRAVVGDGRVRRLRRTGQKRIRPDERLADTTVDLDVEVLIITQGSAPS